MLFRISRQRKIIANRNLNTSFTSEYLSMGDKEKGCLSRPEISEYCFKQFWLFLGFLKQKAVIFTIQQIIQFRGFPSEMDGIPLLAESNQNINHVNWHIRQERQKINCGEFIRLLREAIRIRRKPWPGTIAAVPSKNAVSANIKHCRYFP